MNTNNLSEERANLIKQLTLSKKRPQRSITPLREPPITHFDNLVLQDSLRVRRDRIVVVPSGVGINTDNPKHDLDISGTMHVSGTVLMEADLKIKKNVVNVRRNGVAINKSVALEALDVNGNFVLHGNADIKENMTVGSNLSSNTFTTTNAQCETLSCQDLSANKISINKALEVDALSVSLGNINYLCSQQLNVHDTILTGADVLISRPLIVEKETTFQDKVQGTNVVFSGDMKVQNVTAKDVTSQTMDIGENRLKVMDSGVAINKDIARQALDVRGNVAVDGHMVVEGNIMGANVMIGNTNLLDLLIQLQTRVLTLEEEVRVLRSKNI